MKTETPDCWAAEVLHEARIGKNSTYKTSTISVLSLTPIECCWQERWCNTVLNIPALLECAAVHQFEQWISCLHSVFNWIQVEKDLQFIVFIYGTQHPNFIGCHVIQIFIIYIYYVSYYIFPLAVNQWKQEFNHCRFNYWFRNIQFNKSLSTHNIYIIYSIIVKFNNQWNTANWC